MDVDEREVVDDHRGLLNDDDPEWADNQEKVALLRFLEGSDQVPVGYEVVIGEVADDWAGAYIQNDAEDDGYQFLGVLLKRGADGWSIVEISATLTHRELLDRGIPEKIAAFLACDT